MHIKALRLSDPTSIGAEFGADDDAAVLPAAVDGALHAPGD
jgi:hypothetical protein